jgi:hypothetical protein
MLGRVAEKSAAVKRLTREVKTARTELTERRKDLLALTARIKEGTEPVSVVEGEEPVSLAAAKAALQRKFEEFRRDEAVLQSQEEILKAETDHLRGLKEDWDNLVEQRENFRLQLVRLRAREAKLGAERTRAPARYDAGRVADIANTLKAVEEAQEVEEERRLLERQASGRLSSRNRPGASVDLGAIESHLNGKAKTPSKVASK